MPQSLADPLHPPARPVPPPPGHDLQDVDGPAHFAVNAPGVVVGDTALRRSCIRTALRSAAPPERQRLLGELRARLAAAAAAAAAEAGAGTGASSSNSGPLPSSAAAALAGAGMEGGDALDAPSGIAGGGGNGLAATDSMDVHHASVPIGYASVAVHDWEARQGDRGALLTSLLLQARAEAVAWQAEAPQ